MTQLKRLNKRLNGIKRARRLDKALRRLNKEQVTQDKDYFPRVRMSIPGINIEDLTGEDKVIKKSYGY